MDIQYAPILIPTLNRFEHLKNCIDSLKVNRLAKDTDVYIGVDFPPSEKYDEGYKKIKEYLEKYEGGFKSFNIVYREENFGAVKNINSLIELIVEKGYDTYILTEDDNVFSANYLEFINKSLKHYYDDESVYAICGYSYPVNWVDDNSNIAVCDTFFAGWGAAYWVYKDKQMREEMTLTFLREAQRNDSLMKRMKLYCPRIFCEFMRATPLYHIEYVDNYMAFYMILAGKKTIMPKLSLVRNCGWDGTGIHKVDYMYQNIANNIDFSNQVIDDKMSFELINPQNVKAIDGNRRAINQLLPPPKKFIIRANRLYMFIRIMGVDRFYRVFDVIYTRLKSNKNSRIFCIIKYVYSNLFFKKR